MTPEKEAKRIEAIKKKWEKINAAINLIELSNQYKNEV